MQNAHFRVLNEQGNWLERQGVILYTYGKEWIDPDGNRYRFIAYRVLDEQGNTWTAWPLDIKVSEIIENTITL
jgi:hypothetical protein